MTELHMSDEEYYEYLPTIQQINEGNTAHMSVDQQQQPNETTWETQEVISWLTNDEDTWNALKNRKAWRIRAFVRENMEAPPGLYESFKTTRGASWRNVNWTEVAEALAE